VSCELMLTTVNGYFDGELDAVRAVEFERHLENCGDCQSSLQSIESLSTRLKQADLYEHASAHLREQLTRQLAPTESPARRLFSQRWVLVPSFAILVAAAFIILLFLVRPRTETARLTAELIDAHVRSLQPGHLTDVQSTDQHTVKPWFDGKLDFIPPVSDYSQRGFPLVGGRLDVVDGHDVAALVYAHRKHFINLFVWPSRGTQKVLDSSGSRQGYNWIMWRSGDMTLCMISDVDPSALRELKTLVHP
jgi:anti-sigma factor RsiW